MLLINSKAKAIQIFNAIQLQSLSSPNCHRRIQSKPTHTHIYTKTEREREKVHVEEALSSWSCDHREREDPNSEERERERERERESLNETEIWKRKGGATDICLI